jgi:hypothetical protein
MGLDMYLTAESYIPDNTTQTYKRLQGIESVPFRAKGIEYELMYWRKANAIHNWFVTNVQSGNDDCSRYNVGVEHLKRLVSDIDMALKGKFPEYHMPTQEGFFFGGTQYDEFYEEELKRTKKEVRKIVKYLESDEEGYLDVYYQSSW